MTLQGTVTKSTGSLTTVRLSDGKMIDCRLKGQFRIRDIKHTNPVSIGDRVEVLFTDQDKYGLIISIEPRDNYIIRKATKLSKVSHIIAANLDCAYLVVTLANPRTSNGFIDRFLVTATGYYIDAGLIFNKIDLHSEEEDQTMKKLFTIYQEAGYACYAVSAKDGTGIDGLRTELNNKLSLFSGHSGAGKSALIHTIDPSLNPKTGMISSVHSKGMHTTTFAEMYVLASGGSIVDTPGIKEFGLIDFEKSEIPRCFPEMDRLLPFCQYKNCSHIHEPGCAVKEGLNNGKVSKLRYNSYLSILNDR